MHLKESFKALLTLWQGAKQPESKNIAPIGRLLLTQVLYPWHKSTCSGRSWRFSHRKLIHAEKATPGIPTDCFNFFSGFCGYCEAPIWWCHLLLARFVLLLRRLPRRDTVLFRTLYWGLHLAALKGLLQLIWVTCAKVGLDNVLSTCYLLFFFGLLLYMLIQNTELALAHSPARTAQSNFSLVSDFCCKPNILRQEGGCHPSCALYCAVMTNSFVCIYLLRMGLSRWPCWRLKLDLVIYVILTF